MVGSSSRSNSRPAAASVSLDTAEFLFPDDIPMDVSHTLDQLTGRFRSVRDGLPELIKNSKDQYSRLGVLDRDVRQIIVIADTMRRRIGVIDFAGAHAEDFDGWTTWSSRTAGRNQLSDDIEAGHGNGGKACMVRGATDFAFLEFCFEGRRTRMGFRNDLPKDRYKPGYVCENGISINDVIEPDLEARFQNFLDEFGLSIENLPAPALAAFRERSSFTGVLLDRVVEWENRRKPKIRRLAQEAIPAIIASHGQTAMTIETCEVWLIADGTIVGQAAIAPISLDPHPGFEEPVEHTIPDLLPDPETGDAIDMVCGMDGPRVLRLFTSARQLQMTEETKARNVIRIWNNRNNVANWPLHSLGVLVTSVSFIYGELRCPALVGDHLADVARLHLSDTPLVRALTAWSRQKVQDLAEDLHRAMMAETKPRDREQARATLRSIRDLMRRYLDPDAVGEDDDDADHRGHGGNAGEHHGRRREREGTKFGERIDEIQLEQGRQDITMALGTTVPLRFQCKERQDNGVSKPVRAHDLVLRASPDVLVNFVGVNNISATSAGIGEIWLETKDGSVRSNKVDLWVISAQNVYIRAPEEPLLQGQRVKLAITFQTPDGPAEDVLIEGAVDEPGMGILGRHGRFTAGMKEGQATVRIRFGSNPRDQRAETIQIGPNRMPLDHTGNHGSDIPEILLCGEAAPGMEEYSEEQRTLPGGEEFPTIIEDPQFPNIVWINPNSKEAMRVRRSRGGPSGVSSIASKTFMHFIALKCFDILKRLHVRQALRERTVTELEFLQFAVFAEMECADFIDAAWELSDHLAGKVGSDDA